MKKEVMGAGEWFRPMCFLSSHKQWPLARSMDPAVDAALAALTELSPASAELIRAEFARKDAIIEEQRTAILRQQDVTVQMARSAAQLLFEAGRCADALAFTVRAYVLTGLTAPRDLTQVVDAFYRAARSAARSARASSAPRPSRTRRTPAPPRDRRGTAVRVRGPAPGAASHAGCASRHWREQLRHFLFARPHHRLRRVRAA